MRWIHIVGGLIGIASGAVALVALKGAWLHRRSGRIYVGSMLVMSAAAAPLALAQPAPGNVIPAVLTFYMVATALLTVRRPRRYGRELDTLAMLAALAVGIASVAFGVFRDDHLATSGAYPPVIYFAFAAAALGAAAQDRRLLAAGGLHGPARLTRHLGRMCGALLVATASFFLGQPRVFTGGPLEPVALRAIPVLLVLGALIYWKRQMSRRPLAVKEQAV